MPDANGNPLTDLFGSLANNGGSLIPGQAVKALTSAAVQNVTIETSITPPISYTPKFDESGNPQPSNTSLLNPLRLLKPKVTVQTAGGPIIVAPYGDPGSNYFPHLLAAGVGVVAAGALLGGFARVAKYGAIGAGALLLLGVVRNMGQRSA